MSDAIKTIFEYHQTLSFGNLQNATDQATKVRAAYKLLSASEQTELAVGALDRMEGGDNHCSEVLTCLACFQPGSLKVVHQRMIDAGLHYPGLLYYGAGTESAVQLIGILEKQNQSMEPINLHHLLIAIAWIGDSNVQAAFAEWREKAPSWVSSLHVRPHEYAAEAGWELTDSGQRRTLFAEVAYPLVRHHSGRVTSGEVTIGTATNLKCPWCNSSLVELFSVRNLGKVLLEQAEAPCKALTCPVCTCFGKVFAKHEANGSWSWHSENIRPEYLPPDSTDWDEFPESPLVISNETRHFMEAASWYVPGICLSQVGGYPTWIQYPEFPQCPDCLNLMFFVGQISNEDFDELSEGIYYAFACSECGVSATVYQQS